MTFDWVHYLNFANELVAEVDEKAISSINLSEMQEAKLRAAISRAYYAAFGRASKFLIVEQPSILIPTNGAHSYVYGKFADSKNWTRQDIAVRLKNLRKLRERADYNDAPISNLMVQGRLALAWSREAIEALEKLSSRSA